jgi:U3 small nucleolar RNA-associated protein 3
LIAQSVGATIQGQEYLLVRSMIQKSIALNGVMYLLLKSSSIDDEDGCGSIQSHPIMEQLKSVYSALQKFENDVHNKTKNIDDQLDNLAKAAALMANSGDEEQSDGDDESESLGQPGKEADVSEEEKEKLAEQSENNSDIEYDNEEIAMKNAQMNYQRSINEARFGLRSSEVKRTSKSSRKRAVDHLNDFGDLEQEPSKSDPKLLASTINTIEQRTQSASRKRRPAPIAEELDDLDGHDDQLAQGIKMMEEELGKLHDDDDGGDEEGDMDDEDDEDIKDLDLADDSMEFYKTMAKKSMAKKSFKKSLYQVAPKFPRVDGEVDGERAISKTILKNRGLVAHKAKINRNPRVKKREQYRKALIRRKGAVREVRQEEGHKYGGEGTGIKSGISRSRKLSAK